MYTLKSILLNTQGQLSAVLWGSLSPLFSPLWDSNQQTRKHLGLTKLWSFSSTYGIFWSLLAFSFPVPYPETSFKTINWGNHRPHLGCSRLSWITVLFCLLFSVLKSVFLYFYLSVVHISVENPFCKAKVGTYDPGGHLGLYFFSCFSCTAFKPVCIPLWMSSHLLWA